MWVGAQTSGVEQRSSLVAHPLRVLAVAMQVHFKEPLGWHVAGYLHSPYKCVGSNTPRS